MIKVYNECKDKEETLPQPQLRLEVNGNKEINIDAVDDNGKRIATIWTVYFNSETVFHIDAKKALEREKHSTDWAEWDEDGKFIKLT